MPGLVDVRRHGERGHVAEIVLDRPEAHNAISTAMADALADAARVVDGDASVRAVVLSSSGAKAFCVGADLKERAGFTDDDLRAQRPHLRAAFRGVYDIGVPTIAAVHGFALGGGLEIALSCDLIVCDDTAVLGLPEVTVGLMPGGGGTQLLPQRVGAAVAADLIFTGRRIDARLAARLGLVDRLTATGAQRDKALELAATIAANSPIGVRNAKAAVRRAAAGDVDAGFDAEDAGWQATAFSPDRVEGIRAFNEKRPPDWADPPSQNGESR